MDDTSPSYIENRTCKTCGRFDILCQCSDYDDADCPDCDGNH